MVSFKNTAYLFFILIIAFFLRFYQLGSNPPSLTWDEAAWGYNAYSLGIDGRDEFGKFLPIDHLESFGDFKPPVYAYLDIIPVKIFGLTEFATRFPSALFGVLTILITYFLVKRIFYKSENANIYGILTSFILAISPWHIMLSRAAFEANIATFFIITGVWLFLGGVQERKWYLLFSAISFSFSIYTFNTARVVAPLIILMLGIGFWKILLEKYTQTIMAVIIGILLLLPTLKFLLSPQASLRFKEVNIFSESGVVVSANQQIANDNNSSWSKIIHNRRLAYGVEYIRHYFDNLNPSFLFIKGDGNPKFSTQTVGEMYLWELPFFIMGILFLFKKREGYWWIIPLWLILGIVPAATARETPHALRIETTLPTFQIFTAIGFLTVINLLKKYKKLAISILSFVLFINFMYFYRDYLVHYPREFSGEWQYGYKNSISYVESQKDNFDQIDITMALGRPYIYYLFYTKKNPKDYRKEAIIQREVFGFVNVNGFDKYRFAKNLSDIDNRNKKVLYIGIPNGVPSSANVLKTFYLLNGDKALVAYTL
ncbi:MAG: glycosyltransferase family 39 protein [Candidatus Levybacteria bacterium]|nr:glycosyltransferase family 39 protein [Candidatus Levybacteria bacterium]